MQPIILGSQSERRREILSFFSLPFFQIASHFDESSISFSSDPHYYATTLSLKKAQALFEQFPDRIILTADTVVYFNKMIYNKPVDKEQAHAMLKDLQGNWHSVITAVTVMSCSSTHSEYEETKILMSPLSEEQIRLYHSNCYFLDKAGGYAIQKGGSMIVSKIEGCYYNVMGLPVGTVRSLLLSFGIDLWNHLKPF